jgi:hypothetical protein
MSYKVIQKTAKKNKKGESPLVLKYIYARVVSEISLGFAVLPHQWNEAKQRVTSGVPFKISLSCATVIRQIYETFAKNKNTRQII